MVRLSLLSLALLATLACESTVDVNAANDACELEYDTRGTVNGDVLEVEVWVTAHDEDRTLEIPQCMGITTNGDIFRTCDPSGEDDLTGCEPAMFTVRADTSLQIAYLERPLAGDVCNEPLEPGINEIGALGLETGDLAVCRLFAAVAIPN